MDGGAGRDICDSGGEDAVRRSGTEFHESGAGGQMLSADLLPFGHDGLRLRRIHWGHASCGAEGGRAGECSGHVSGTYRRDHRRDVDACPAGGGMSADPAGSHRSENPRQLHSDLRPVRGSVRRAWTGSGLSFGAAFRRRSDAWSLLHGYGLCD